MKITLVPNLKELFLQWIPFMAVWIGLSLLVFKPLVNVIAERKKRVEGALSEAKKLQKQADAYIQQFEEELHKVKIEGAKQRETIRQETVQQERELLNKARAHAEEYIQEARSSLRKEVETTREHIVSATQSLSQEIAEKVLGNVV